MDGIRKMEDSMEMDGIREMTFSWEWQTAWI